MLLNNFRRKLRQNYPFICDTVVYRAFVTDPPERYLQTFTAVIQGIILVELLPANHEQALMRIAINTEIESVVFALCGIITSLISSKLKKELTIQFKKSCANIFYNFSRGICWAALQRRGKVCRRNRRPTFSTVVSS